MGLNIYVFGGKSFVKQIHKTLNKAKIIYKMDANSGIFDIKSVDELKERIIENSNEIYLIDNDKIIKENFITDKLKFLKPKDGIEKDFLETHNIDDISVDSYDALATWIINKIDPQNNEKKSEELSDEALDKLAAQRENTKQITKNINIEQPKVIEVDDIYIKHKKEELNMADVIDQIDDISEMDILDALNGLDDMDISKIVTKDTKVDNSVVLNSDASPDEIAKLISGLLKNQTLEISIRVK